MELLRVSREARIVPALNTNERCNGPSDALKDTIRFKPGGEAVMMMARVMIVTSPAPRQQKLQKLQKLNCALLWLGDGMQAKALLKRKSSNWMHIIGLQIG